MARSLEEMKNDMKRFFDWWNGLGAVALIILFLILTVDSLSPLSFKLNTQTGILMLTGIYAYTTFNQMRESRQDRQQCVGMALRPRFIQTDGGCALVLYNFGEGAALDIRLRIIHISKDGNECYDVIGPNDTVHLSEDEYYPIPTDELFELKKSSSDLPEDDDGRLEFYYTWESQTGRQYPHDIDKPHKKSMDDIVCQTENPRTVRLTESLSKVS